MNDGRPVARPAPDASFGGGRIRGKMRTTHLHCPTATTKLSGMTRPPRGAPGRSGSKDKHHAGTRHRARVPGTGSQERAGPGDQTRRAARPAPRDGHPADRRSDRGAPGPRRPAHLLPGQATQARPVQAVHHRLEVPAARTHRGRRHGCRVPVRTHAHEAAGGAQGAARREARRPLEPGAVLPRGAGRRRPRPPEHRPRLRHRPVRQVALPRHGVRGRAQPPGGHRPVRAGEEAVRPGPRRALRRAGGRGDAARPRTRHGPPRHQTGQPAARPHRRHQSPRHGSGAVLQQAAGQRHREVRRQVRAGHRRLPRAGAGADERGGRAGGHLLARRHAVLHAHRPHAVPGRHHRGQAGRAPDARAAPGR